MLTKIIMLESEEKNAKFEKLQNTILKSIKELNNLLKDKHEFILINAEISKEIIQNKEEGQYFLFYSCCASRCFPLVLSSLQVLTRISLTAQ